MLRFRNVCLMNVFLLTIPVSVADETSPAAVAPGSSVGRLIAVMDAVIEHHIDPPTRQQMVLDLLRFRATIGKTQLAPGVAKRISKAPPDQLGQILTRELTDLSPPTHRRSTVENLLAPQYVQRLAAGVSVTNAEANRINEQLSANLYVGIGIQLQSSRAKADGSAKRNMIGRVLPGGPAFKAGAKDGDIFLQVDGKDVDRLSLAALVERLRGPRGTDVEVVVKQPDEETPRTYKMTRDVVPIASVSSAGYSKARQVACITVKELKASTVHELRKVEAELDAATEAVVLDFRLLQDHNLHNGKLLANALIDGGVVGSAETTAGNETFTAEPGRLFAERRLGILIGPMTAGTPEWIAAGLKDLKQATVSGATTGGNGLISDTVATSESDLMVTLPVGRLNRADGSSLHVSTDPNAVAEKIVMPENSFIDLPAITSYLNPQPGGVQPELGDIVWAKPSGGWDSDNGRAVAAGRFAKLLLLE